ncbi:hypothetical protein B0H11DRAFT_1347089 [Mycena galericulata]|nr:hypothetical protein B0H11DRAFT_1347089 [Mycena galericulata]
MALRMLNKFSSVASLKSCAGITSPTKVLAGRLGGLGQEHIPSSRSVLRPLAASPSWVGRIDLFYADLTISPPVGWENGQHPDDYKILPTPLQPQYIINPHLQLTRMWYRISFKIADGQYMPMSFLVDTNISRWLYLSDKASNALTEHGRIFDRYKTRLENGLCFEVQDSPYEPVNVIGLALIQKFELSVTPGSFRWMKGIEYW